MKLGPHCMKYCTKCKRCFLPLPFLDLQPTRAIRQKLKKEVLLSTLYRWATGAEGNYLKAFELSDFVIFTHMLVWPK